MALKNFSTWIRNYGYPLRRIPYDAWREEMLALAARPDQKSLSSFIMPFFNTDISNSMDRVIIVAVGARYGTEVQFNCGNALKDLVGTDIACPPVDDRLLNTYFSYLIRIGYLHPPTR